MCRIFLLEIWCPRRDSNSYGRFYVRGILNPLCLPFHHQGTRKSRDDDVMFLRLCQLKTLVLGLVILNSCTWGREKIAAEGVKPKAKWFRINQEHALEDTLGPKRHLFFDAQSRIDWGEGTVKFVALTPQDSRYSYGMDLASGQPFTQHEYCQQKDVWGQYSGNVHRPPYTQGFVPRVLDQLGTPQKIIYFSRKSVPRAFEQYEARIIGGYVESLCPVMDCQKLGEWHSRLVLIGVDPEDPDLHEYRIPQIKEKLNWPKVKGHIENIEGKNFLGNDTFPRWKASEPINLKETLSFFRKRAKFFKGKELLSVQKSCHELYDNLWTKVGEVRLEDLAAESAEAVKQKLEVISLLRANNEPVGFLARFTDFTEKYYKDVLTCSKFIYSGNINQNPEKFWFINYVKAFYLLYQQGYYYHCGGNAWRRNILKENGDYFYSVQDTLKECKIDQIDMAMNYIPNFIRAEKGKTSEFLRFIDYDNQAMGTHEKIYNWVHFPHIKLTCSNDQHDRFLQSLNVFVDDVSWEARTPKKDYDDKVIY